MRKLALILVLLITACSTEQNSACPYDSCRNRSGFMYAQNVFANTRGKSYSNARFTKLSFSKGNDNYGTWRGYVHGQGQARLYLNIKTGGYLQESRYIGSVNLRKDSPIAFHFKSYLPKLNNWNWEIISG